MLPLTQGSEPSNRPKTNNVGLFVETLALFFVIVFLVAVILAITTIYQNGFQ
jgi:hypothetical protein